MDFIQTTCFSNAIYRNVKTQQSIYFQIINSTGRQKKTENAAAVAGHRTLARRTIKHRGIATDS